MIVSRIQPKERLRYPVVGRYSEDLGYSIQRPRGSGDFLLILTIDGVGFCRSGEASVELTHGSVALFRPETPQDYGTLSSRKPWSFYWAHFLPRPDWVQWLVWDGQTQRPFVRLCRPDLFDSAALAFERCFSREPQVPQLIDAFRMNSIERVLLELFADYGFNRKVDPRIQAAVAAMRRFPEQPFDLSELARIAGLSASRFSHLFTESVGLPPIKFLEVQRLERAKQLLVTTSASVSEISAMSGFQNPYHFSTRFKKFFGVSPSELRGRSS